jgi:putative protease
MEEKLIGKITHYFTNIGVGVIEITEDSLKVGDSIHIKGATTDFEQKVESMQIEHENVQEATTGQAVGLKVDQPVRENDQVYKIIE